jgi:hemerythrin-like domain-containing protein
VILCAQLRRLAAEHARWLEEIERDAARQGSERAARLLALWEVEVAPHCRVEEDVLLPELARRLSEADAAVVFTLGDHVALRRLARELRGAGPAQAGAACAELAQRLAEHAAFEERTLFPALQETIGCDELARLAEEIAAPRRERQHRPANGSPAAHQAANHRKGRKS